MRLHPDTALHLESESLIEYARAGAQAILFVPLLTGGAVIHCASSGGFKQIMQDTTTFVKPRLATVLECVLLVHCAQSLCLLPPISLLGPNVNTLNKEEWRRHRKVTAPAFDNQM